MNARLLIPILSCLALICLFLAVDIGTIHINGSELFHTLTGHGTSFQQKLIFELRWPRASSAFVTGGLLALAGTLMQVLLRNPLADPYILGVSGGCCRGQSSGDFNWFRQLWVEPIRIPGCNPIHVDSLPVSKMRQTMVINPITAYWYCHCHWMGGNNKFHPQYKPQL